MPHSRRISTQGVSLGTLFLVSAFWRLDAAAPQTQVPAPPIPSSLTGALPSEAPQGEALAGRIVDPAGLPVAGADVTLRNILTGAELRMPSNTGGVFRFTGITPGGYSLTATAPGLSLENVRFSLARHQTRDTGDLRMTLTHTAQQVTVVSGSRTAELQDESPAKVLVAAPPDILRTGYERVSDVLSEMPGIVTRVQSYGVGITGGEQIDGMDSKETLVLLDGLPVTGARGITEGTIDLNNQSTGRIDHVEVVKGAASALYGTDALGGVINLISRTPVEPFTVDASLSGGSLGQVDGRLGIGGLWKKLTVFADVESHQIDSYALIPGDNTTTGANENSQDLLVKIRYAFSPRAALGFTATGYRTHDQGRGNTLLFDPDDPESFSFHPAALRSNESGQTYALVGDFIPLNSTTLQLRAYMSRFDQNSRSNLIDSAIEQPAFDLGNLTENYRRADATVGRQLGARQFLQIGYEWVQDEYAGDNRIVGGSAGQQLTTNDVWLQDRIQPIRNLTLTLGGRFQENSQFGGHAVPKAGAVYRLGAHWILRGSFGAGFRAPNLGELYYHLLHLEYGYQVIGNPALTPETSRSGSAGAAYVAGRYRLSLNLFRNNLKNLIDNVLVCDATSGQVCAGPPLQQLLAAYHIPPSFNYDATGAALFTFINQNVDRAYTQGFDVDGQIALRRSLTLSGAYTYLEAVDSVNNAWLPNRNRHQGHMKLEYAPSRWGLVANVRGTFFSRWPVDTAGDYAYGYRIWNLYASKSLVKGVDLYGAMDNFLNSRDPKLASATPSYDRPDYGRTFRLGMRFTLPRRE